MRHFHSFSTNKSFGFTLKWNAVSQSFLNPCNTFILAFQQLTVLYFGSKVIFTTCVRIFIYAVDKNNLLENVYFMMRMCICWI